VVGATGVVSTHRNYHGRILTADYVARHPPPPPASVPDVAVRPPGRARVASADPFPVLLSALDLLPFALGLAQPVWFTAVQIVLVSVTAPVLVGITGLVGGMAGRLGGWLAQRSGHPRPATGW